MRQRICDLPQDEALVAELSKVRLQPSDLMALHVGFRCDSESESLHTCQQAESVAFKNDSTPQRCCFSPRNNPSSLIIVLRKG